MTLFSWLFSSKHKENVAFKQREQADRIAALTEYHKPITPKEAAILKSEIAETVKLVKAGELKPREVLKAFGKQALLSQERTQCLTEIMIKDAEKWADEAPLDGPLAGFPISLKDHFIVGGYDASAGYSKLVRHPYKEDGNLAKLIKNAGGLPYVKTNVPITMMAIEGYNDIFGRVKNPWNPNFAPGGSSQGEAALIASGGSRAGIGSDIGGSVRVPAAWSGIYSLRMTSWRFPLEGDIMQDGGFEGVPAVASPMAKTIGDLRYFIEAIFSEKPWNYDHRIVPFEWRSKTTVPAKPKVGVIKFDDFLPLTPAQNRALDTAIDALKKKGAEIVVFKAPEPTAVYDRNVWDLYGADHLEGSSDKCLPGEHNDPYVLRARKYTVLPRFVRRAWEWLLWLVGFKTKSQIYAMNDAFDVPGYYDLVSKRQHLRTSFAHAYDKSGVDFLITAPHPSPAVPIRQPESFYMAVYTTIFNLLDMPAGIIPVSRVSKELDQLGPYDSKKLTWQAKITYESYDADKMEGLPTAVQVVGKRYYDEKVLAAMEYVDAALKSAGVYYE